MVTGGGQPGPFGINTAISRLQRTPRELIMKIGLLPDPCRTHWIRDSTALERTGSGVSWRSSWPGALGPWCGWCRGDLSPVSGDGPPGWAGRAGTSAGGGDWDVSGRAVEGWGRRREGYAGRWEVKLDNIAALAAEREQLARTPEGGSRGGGFGVAPG